MTIAPVHHILPLTTILRERILPIKGTVLAHMGQKVNSADVVAEAVWAREHYFLDVARTLDLSPDAADQLIRCKQGDRVSAGTVIAKGHGLVPKTVRAPREGRVVAAGGGQVLLEAGEFAYGTARRHLGKCYAGDPGTRCGDPDCRSAYPGHVGQRAGRYGRDDQPGG